VTSMVETGQRVGGTSELQVGEGRADAPVGTTIALIDQATKILNSVHKRMHAAQADEFNLLSRCFREHPESFLEKTKKASTEWTEAVFIQALNDCELVPQADPNTASHTQRVMKIMALKQLQQANPSMYDPRAIDTAALQAMGWNNPEQFMTPENATQQPPPEVMKAMEELKIMQQEAQAKTLVAQASVDDSKLDGQIKMMDAQTRQMLAQAKIAETNAKIGGGEGGDERWHQIDAETKMMDAETRRKQAEIQAAKLGVDLHKVNVDSQHKEADRILDSHHRQQDRMHDGNKASMDRALQAQQLLQADKEPGAE